VSGFAALAIRGPACHVRKEAAEVVRDAGVNDRPLPALRWSVVEGRAFWLIVLAAGIAAGKYWEALQIRAIETDQPVTATIISIWTEPRKHGEAKMGRISFTRQQGGREISCTITVAIERLPTSLHFVGKEVDIVPRSNSCYDPIIPILLP
jgi:hypothetical protein